MKKLLIPLFLFISVSVSAQYRALIEKDTTNLVATKTNLLAKADTSGYLKQYFDKSVFINSPYKYISDPNHPLNVDTTMFYVKGKGAINGTGTDQKYVGVFADSSDRQLLAIDNGGELDISGYGTSGYGAIVTIGKYSTAMPNDFNHLAYEFKGSKSTYTAASIIGRVTDTTATALKSEIDISLMNSVDGSAGGHPNTNLTYVFLPTGFYIPSTKSLVFNNDVQIKSSATGLIDITGGANFYGTLYGSNFQATTSVKSGSIYAGGTGTTPNSSLQTLSFSTGYVAKSTSYTATISDHTIEVTATGATITLPTAVGIYGREYVIKLTASGSATVATTSSQTIDGATTYSLSMQYKYVKVQSNGANWLIIANN